MIDKHVALVKSEFSKLDRNNLEKSMALVTDPNFLLIALLGAVGFDPVSVEKVNSVHRYYTDVYGNKISLLEADFKNNTLDGPAEKDIKSALFLVCAIEGELSNAMEYPHELRSKVIKSVINDSRSSVDFYKKVLSNWKEFK